MKFGAPLPDEFVEWQLVFDTGWTLEQVRNTPIQDIHNYIQIKDGIAKASKR